jgi:hypothetical protein
MIIFRTNIAIITVSHKWTSYSSRHLSDLALRYKITSDRHFTIFPYNSYLTLTPHTPFSPHVHFVIFSCINMLSHTILIHLTSINGRKLREKELPSLSTASAGILFLDPLLHIHRVANNVNLRGCNAD